MHSVVHGPDYAGRIDADLVIAPVGVHAVADTVHGLLEARMLSSCSIGFRAIDAKPNEFGGHDIAAWELYEASVCAIPANPEALLAAALGHKAGLGADRQPGAFVPTMEHVRLGVRKTIRELVESKLRYATGRLD